MKETVYQVTGASGSVQIVATSSTEARERAMEHFYGQFPNPSSVAIGIFGVPRGRGLSVRHVEAEGDADEG